MIPVSCIVEGHGDVEAAPALFRRISEQRAPDLAGKLEFPHPIRIPKDKLLKTGELERAVDLAGRRVRPRGCIFIVVDADDDCPRNDAPRLLARAQAQCRDLPVGFVMAKVEWESWFLAAASSLRGIAGLPQDLEAPFGSENIRGAKEWLSRHMPRGEPYSETLHQAMLTRAFNLGAARGADSFDKCYREIGRLVDEVIRRNR